MRCALVTLLLLFLAAPGAGAQAPAALSIDPMPGPVPPLQGPVVTNATLVVVCPAEVRLRVVSAPSWAEVVVAPERVSFDEARCAGGWAEEKVTVSVRANETAPAFEPAPVVVEVLEDGREEGTGHHASVDVMASWFSILDVHVPEAIRQVGPGEVASFAARVANLGNGPARVLFEPGDVAEGLEVLVPDPLVLPSRLEGEGFSADVTVRVTTTGGGFYVNRVGTASVLVRAESVDPAGFVGDGTTISFLVSEKGFATPGPSTPALLVALVGAALLVGARRVRSR